MIKYYYPCSSYYFRINAESDLICDIDRLNRLILLINPKSEYFGIYE